MRIQFYIFFCLLLLNFSCSKQEPDIGLLGLLDHIPFDHYYPTDDLSEEADIRGIWRVESSSGGETGAGYGKDFDHLLVKSNGIFGLEKANELLASGKIQRITRTDGIIAVLFKADFNPNPFSYQLIIDNEKYIEFRSDSLDLISPCCDRFNTHLVKQN